MPTKRTRKSRNRVSGVSPELWAYLADVEPQDPEDHFFEWHNFQENGRELWAQYREQVLADWIETKGGTRPSCWWLFDAPRLANIPERHAHCYYTPEMIEPRRLLSGAGRPAWEVLSIVPRYRYGVPTSWVGWEDDAPPVFEDQFDYLRRHGLLAPGERHMTDGPTPELTTY